MDNLLHKIPIVINGLHVLFIVSSYPTLRAMEAYTV